MNEPSDLREVGARIELALTELRATLARRDWEIVEETMALVTELYGGGLGRIMELAPPDVATRLAGDDLVASLLIIHGLHPLDLEQRVRDALESVRPYMGSHGGNVEIDALDADEGNLRLRMLGSCDGCPSSAVTLELAVRRAIEATAPEIVTIEVVDASPPRSAPVTLAKKPALA